MKNVIRVIALFLSRFLPIDLQKNILGLSIVSGYFKSLKQAPFFRGRQNLWEYICSDFKHQKILFLEFGVHKGYSINFFSKLNSNAESVFVGFDSFEGLPTDWQNFVKRYPKNHFDVGGELPQTTDARVSFEKGWFQDTVPNFLANCEFNSYEQTIIHLDADIYGSTLYVLTQFAETSGEIIFIFDQLPGEEARALNDFIDSFGGQFEFLGYSGPVKAFPMQVAIRYRDDEMGIKQ